MSTRLAYVPLSGMACVRSGPVARYSAPAAISVASIQQGSGVFAYGLSSNFVSDRTANPLSVRTVPAENRHTLGKGVDGRGYVLADRSCKLSPAGWGRRAVDAYHECEADRIVAERNYGGAMVEHVIRATDSKAAYAEVVASRGKVLRAEPIAALYEQGA